MLILATGARDHTDRALIAEALTWTVETTQDIPGRQVALIHGACPQRRVKDSWASADAIADSLARSWGWLVYPYPAREHGGPLPRNRAMVRACAAYRDQGVVVRVLAFPLPCARPDCRTSGGHWSHGTAHCAGEAIRAGLVGWWVLPDGEKSPLTR